MNIRPFRVGDEPALLDVFRSAILDVASADYSQRQVDAWSTVHADAAEWSERMREIQPFVVEIDGRIVAYGDVQADGYIDHFFVTGAQARRGVGSQLMRHLLAVADARGLVELTSDVSLTAQPFFARFGFELVERREVTIRGVVLSNALMRRRGTSGARGREEYDPDLVPSGPDQGRGS